MIKGFIDEFMGSLIFEVFAWRTPLFGISSLIVLLLTLSVPCIVAWGLFTFMRENVFWRCVGGWKIQLGRFFAFFAMMGGGLFSMFVAMRLLGWCLGACL